VARLNEDAQWIILMGFIVSFSIFFLALVINQSTVVGQTTAEGVIEFPKNDIRDLSDAITSDLGSSNEHVIREDFRLIALNRKNALVNYSMTATDDYTIVKVHYNNGVTMYEENWTSLYY
jgi:hypothetical protein